MRNEGKWPQTLIYLNPSTSYDAIKFGPESILAHVAKTDILVITSPTHISLNKWDTDSSEPIVERFSLVLNATNQVQKSWLISTRRYASDEDRTAKTAFGTFRTLNSSGKIVFPNFLDMLRL